jgi:hypothetical protein
MKKLSIPFVLAALFVVGCGGDDGGSPTEKCQAFASAVCSKFVTCQLASSMSSCVSEFGKALECNRAVGVSATYDSCLSDINAATCDQVRASPSDLPPSCSKTIKIQ